MDYIERIKGIKTQNLSTAVLVKGNVLDFLAWIENTKGVTIQTRNQRLAAIHSFLSIFTTCGHYAYRQMAGNTVHKNQKSTSQADGIPFGGRSEAAFGTSPGRHRCQQKGSCYACTFI
ncbi:hypothetical protein NXW52_12670 [Bacteroides ovatus]|nr:hypothetical protein NXW52_12670 [Bacteroides ovatus]